MLSPLNTLPSRTSQNVLSSRVSQNPPLSKASLNTPPVGAIPPRTKSLKSNAHVIAEKHKPLTDLNTLDGNVNLNKDYMGEKTAVEKVKDFLDSQSGVSDSTKDELISVSNEYFTAIIGLYDH